MEKKCKNCMFWKLDKTLHWVPKGHKNCEAPQFVYGDKHQIGEDSLAYWDSDFWSAMLSTGPEFGCIHFKQMDDK